MLPFNIFAAASKSSYFAPVQEPIYDLSSSIPVVSLTTDTLSGENGLATKGSSSDASYSNVFSYCASSSSKTGSYFVSPRFSI